MKVVERLRSIAEGYERGRMQWYCPPSRSSPPSRRPVPAVTETIRPWDRSGCDQAVDRNRHRQRHMYVVLDLQSGRSDFLSQAKIIRGVPPQLPNVGLALDPEWRLKSHQVHLEQIGTVDAAEINQVVDWLADLVRDHALPQKLLIVHQFRILHDHQPPPRRLLPPNWR